MKNEKLSEVREFLEGKARLVAVSKYRTEDEIMGLYNSGQREFAENRVQALIERHDSLPKDIEWHLIGHLQRNKVKHVLPIVSLIHSVDSLRLIKEIHNQALKLGIIAKVLIQVHVAQEDSKFGLKPIELDDFFKAIAQEPVPNVEVCGIMAMATNTSETRQVENEFNEAKGIFDQIKNTFYQKDENFKELSMGMSSDYKEAVKCGSTLVRIGSLLY